MAVSRIYMSALCLPSPGSAVSKHESWLGTCSDGYQVQVACLHRPQVSFQDRHTHRMGFISFFHTWYLNMFLPHQWASAAPMVGGVVLEHGCCRKMVSAMVIPSQSWMGTDQVWTQVRDTSLVTGNVLIVQTVYKLCAEFLKLTFVYSVNMETWCEQ